MIKAEKKREKIFEILELNDGTNRISWWNIATEICERNEKELKKERIKAYKKGYFKGVLDSEHGLVKSDELLKEKGGGVNG